MYSRIARLISSGFIQSIMRGRGRLLLLACLCLVLSGLGRTPANAQPPARVDTKSEVRSQGQSQASGAASLTIFQRIWQVLDGGEAVSASHGEAAGNEAAPPPWGESWNGAHLSSGGWAVFSGTTLAPFGSIYEPGWRLRMSAVTNNYAYEGWRTGANGIARDLIEFTGQTNNIEALVGYQARFGELTVKAFAGWEWAERNIYPADEYSGSGYREGARLALETWLNLSDANWISVDASYGDAFGDYALSAKAGHRVTRNLSLGVEFVAFGHDEYEGMRAGALARLNWPRWGEFEGVIGMTGEQTGFSDVYGAVNHLSRF